MTNWQKQARKLFNPYAQELKFDKRDWEVFLNRLGELLSEERKKGYEEGARHQAEMDATTSLKERLQLLKEIENWANKNKFPFEVCAKIEELINSLK